jgi:hypothetical protein
MRRRLASTPAVEHSTITDLPPFGIAVLPFKDPDGVALELTAPL